MPSGARSTEHGRPLIWLIIHSPTASKYFARSSFVTALPSPPSGHSALSGLEMTTPITSADLLADDVPDLINGFATLVITGLSASTSFAGLSCRNPLNAA